MKSREPIFAEAQLSPEEVVAADSVEFVIRLIVGPRYTKDASRIVFDFPVHHGASVPTVEGREKFGYVEAYVSNPNVAYNKRCWNTRKEAFVLTGRFVILDLSAGLVEGDVIELHVGDPQGGFCPGTITQMVVPRPRSVCDVFVRYFDSQEKGLPDVGVAYDDLLRPTPDAEVSLRYIVRPRPAQELRLIRKRDRTILVPRDRFLNAADVQDTASLVETNEPPLRNEFGAFVYASSNARIVSRGLPLYETPRMEDVFDGMNLYWGELHVHSCWSWDIRAARSSLTPAELMAFARDRCGLDFLAVADHHDPWLPDPCKVSRGMWQDTLQAVEAFHEPGRFITWPAIEYHGIPDVPDPTQRGDTVIVFNWLPEYDEINARIWKDIREVWRDLRGRDFLTIPHFHKVGQLKEDEWWICPDEGVEPVIEMYSDHGSFEREDALESGRAPGKSFRRDRCAVYLLKHGLRYGWAANSDDHKGRAGINGLTAVFSKSLERAALLDAYRNRRVYATTNARIRMVFTAQGALMGSVLPNVTPKRFHVDVIAERDIKKVELFRNGDLHTRFAARGRTFRQDVRIEDSEPSNWYVRVTQLDNHVAWSSPVWYE